eukprot:10353-Heterococcus_DN1.PRE.5
MDSDDELDRTIYKGHFSDLKFIRPKNNQYKSPYILLPFRSTDEDVLVTYLAQTFSKITAIGMLHVVFRDLGDGVYKLLYVQLKIEKRAPVLSHTQIYNAIKHCFAPRPVEDVVLGFGRLEDFPRYPMKRDLYNEVRKRQGRTVNAEMMALDVDVEDMDKTKMKAVILHLRSELRTANRDIVYYRGLNERHERDNWGQWYSMQAVQYRYGDLHARPRSDDYL